MNGDLQLDSHVIAYEKRQNKLRKMRENSKSYYRNGKQRSGITALDVFLASREYSVIWQRSAQLVETTHSIHDFSI